MSRAGTGPGRLVALSTASVFPDRTADAFEVAARLGYDGVEVMVTAGRGQPGRRRAPAAGRLPQRPGAGRARALPADHPAGVGPRAVGQAGPGQGGGREAGRPGRRGASPVPLAARLRQGLRGRAWRGCSEETDVVFAVENMYPLRAGGAEVAAYAPHWNPVLMDTRTSRWTSPTRPCPGRTRWPWPTELGGRLAHVHMADGTGVPNRDEHLVPGRGSPAVRAAAGEAGRRRVLRRGRAGGQHPPRGLAGGPAGRPGRGAGVHPRHLAAPPRPTAALPRGRGAPTPGAAAAPGAAGTGPARSAAGTDPVGPRDRRYRRTCEAAGR